MLNKKKKHKENKRGHDSAVRPKCSNGYGSWCQRTSTVKR